MSEEKKKQTPTEKTSLLLNKMQQEFELDKTAFDKFLDNNKNLLPKGVLNNSETIKKPKNAFQLFCDAERPRVIDAGFVGPNVLRELRIRWMHTSRERLDSFVRQAADDRERFRKQMSEKITKKPIFQSAFLMFYNNSKNDEAEGEEIYTEWEKLKKSNPEIINFWQSKADEANKDLEQRLAEFKKSQDDVV